jgi:hypothetical protein
MEALTVLIDAGGGAKFDETVGSRCASASTRARRLNVRGTVAAARHREEARPGRRVREGDKAKEAQDAGADFVALTTSSRRSRNSGSTSTLRSRRPT